ncbi:MAG TPA: hypothetical protein VI818_03035, partial [Candidatus Thermoplasmatota archaeon]|nr:hypothetical protein [Candidatus Thermoplasmatota archaeon]
MRSVGLSLLFVVSSVAGCLGGAPPSPLGADDDDLLPPGAPVALGPGAHTHDVWGDAVRMDLGSFSGTASREGCSQYGDESYLLEQAVHAVESQRAEVGCFVFSLPQGVFVPEGTAGLRLAGDVAQALQAGEVRASVRTAAKNRIEGDRVAGAGHEWAFELKEADWDLPHQARSAFLFRLDADGVTALFDGPVTVSLVAERRADWDPRFSAAHIDHWALP